MTGNRLIADIAITILFGAALSTGLGACALFTATQKAVQTGQLQPLDPALVQQDIAAGKTLACIDATGAVIAAPLLAATGNAAAGAIAGAAGGAVQQKTCPPGAPLLVALPSTPASTVPVVPAAAPAKAGS